MSEDNNSLPAGEQPKRTVRMKLDGKFGVSEERQHGFGRGPDSRIAGDRNDRKSFGSKPSKDYRDRSYQGDRPAFGDRKPFGDRREGGFRSDRPQGDRPAFGDRKSFGDRREGGFRSDRPQGDRPAFGDRKPFGDRREGGFRSDRPRQFGNRDERRGERKVWNDHGDHPGAPVFRQRPAAEAPEFVEETTVAPVEIPEGAEETLAEKDPPWFRRILALTTDKGREREEKFLAEGIRVIEEMLQYHPDIVNGVYVVEGNTDSPIADKAREAGVRVHDLTPDQMAKLSTTVNGPGVVAVCRCASRKPDYDLGHFITLVDSVQDPGNLGSLFRTSLGFNSDGMLLGKGTVNPFNPKVVRGSSGTFLRVPFEHGVELAERIQFLRQKGYCIIATDLHAKQSLSDISPRKLRKVALIMGNEGAGAEQGLIELADEWVRIPMGQSLESLNVAVAHGILSYQLAQIQEKV